ncbi:MAG: hypothetical protein CMQ21_13655 [Gammaproteobacteria bacterium]|nr:hypothetical protein [Gammaproteobacteria bacterium]
MKIARLISALSLINLKSLPDRSGASLVVVVGIAGVVAVLVSLLAMAHGYEETLGKTGRTDRALLLRSGALLELSGGTNIDEFPIISRKPGIARVDDKPLAAMETYVTVKLKEIGSDQLASVPMRGISEDSFRVRPEVKISKGRRPDSGKLELLAGASVAERLHGLSVGDITPIRGTDWKVVGHFTAAGGAYESEIWADERLLAGLHNRGPTFSSALVQLESEHDFDFLVEQLEDDRRLTARAIRESDYYSAQSKQTTQLIQSVGILIAVIMSVGAIFAALNTMYAAIAARRLEIATLKALGFRPMAIFFTVVLEALTLSLLGGVIGAGTTYLFFNGYRVSTAGGSFMKVSFDFMVTQELLVIGISLAAMLGVIGGAIPAFSAVRRSIIDGLREV